MLMLPFNTMRLSAKLILSGSGIVILVGVLLFAGGCLSIPRDFASPPATIRIVDQSGVPILNLEVSRDWYDNDTDDTGDDDAVADQTGSYQFPKIPANVGLFTGTWRKMYTSLGICGSGSGTYTTINVRYHGLYDVVPKQKTLHQVGLSSQDQDGVWFDIGVDDHSNTLLELKFQKNAKIINYELSSKPHGK
jgi:hypothetical protein